MLNKKGFTIIELVIAISLISVLILISSNFLNYNIRSYRDTNDYYKHKIEARYAMDKVVLEINRNYGISYNNGKVLGSDASVLVNSTPNELSGNIQFYFDADRYGIGDGYGEIRGVNGESIIKNIKEFTIESPETNIIKILIKTGKENDKKTFQLITYVRLYD